MATNSIDKLFSFLEEQNPILFKLQPPRPGLVPQSGSYEHPYRWIRDKESRTKERKRFGQIGTADNAKYAVWEFSQKYIFRKLQETFGKRPDGEFRIQVVKQPLFHRSEELENIYLNGFDPEKRNKVLLGFSFVPEDSTEQFKGIFSGGKLQDTLKAYFIGAMWDPAGPEDRPINVLSGHSFDPVWNSLAKQIAQKVGLDWNQSGNEFFQKRKEYATGMRKELLSRGISAVRIGAEITVLDPDKMFVVEKGKAKPIQLDGSGGGEGGLSGGGTVATSTDPGIFTPTYGGNERKKKKTDLFNGCIENAQVAHHTHDGFKEHPVAVKDHQDYFSDTAKTSSSLPFGEELTAPDLRRFYAAYKLRQAGNLDVSQKEFVESMIGGVSDDELKEFFRQQYGRQKKEITQKTPPIKIPDIIEGIDAELKALGRARVRPWGSKDVVAQNNISDRVRQLSEKKKKLEENSNIQKFQDFVNTAKSDLSSPWFGKTYVDVFKEFPVTEIAINKASKKNIIATPMKEGKFDASAVPSGASTWITITAPDSPLRGRHVLISKLPDGRFALTGGMGVDESTEARRHLILGGTPRKTRRDEQLETEMEEAEALNEPLRVAKKEVEKEARAEIKKASDSMLEALGFKKFDKEVLLAKKDEVQKYVEVELGGAKSSPEAKRITDVVMRHFVAAEREVKERVQVQRQIAIARIGKRLASLKDMAEIAEDLPEDINSLGITIPEISSLENLTPGEQELAISRHFGEQVDNFFSEEPVPAGAIELPGKKEKLPILELGATIEPLKLESVEQLRSTIDTVKNYWTKKAEAEQIKSQIRKVTKVAAIPSTIADLQKLIAESGATMSLEEIEQKVLSDQNQWMRNERSQSFYDAVGDFWDDDKSLEEALESKTSDASMYHHISTGAATSLAALSQQYSGVKLDTKRLLEAANIEVGSAALALEIRQDFYQRKDAKGYDKLIQEVQTFNAANQTETERKALERHTQLKSQYGEIQRQKAEAELLDKVRIATLESDLILEQRKNLGAALGSMQASAAFLDSLTKFRSATDDVISINVGKDVNDAFSVIERLKLRKTLREQLKRDIDASDPENVKINIGISNLGNLITGEKGIQTKADKYEKLKTDMSGVSEDEEGRLTVDNFDVPGFKKEWTDEAGKTHPYKWRVEQRNDINWLMEASKKTSENPEGIGGGLITRVTGAGKTNTAFGFFGFQLKENPDYKALAIVPRGRTQQWADEAKKFTDLNVEVIPEGLARDKVEELLAKSKKGTVYIAAHREAAKASDMLQAIQHDKDLKFSGFVVDEPQELQARGQSGNIGEMGKRIFRVPVKHRIALTATPARRNPTEVYSLIKWTSGTKDIGTKAFFDRVFSGFGSGTNAQDTAIGDMFFKTVQPYISGDRLTTPNFKVKQNNINIIRSPEQITRQKEIEAGSAKHIIKRRDEISNEIKNNPTHPFRRSRTWESRLSKYANDIARKEIAQMHKENFDNRSITTGAKMVALKNELQKGLKEKQVIFIDSQVQKHSLQTIFNELGLKQNQIKNIASGVTSMSGEEMAARAHAFQKDPNVKIILVDKNSATGFNLQQGSRLHIVGTPPDAATLLQVNGRVARQPRTGDVEVLSYRYSDNPTEAALFNAIDNQLKILRSSSPGLFLGQ